MRAQTLFNAKPIVFDSILRLGSSGQTDVYALIQDVNLAAKVLERPSVGLARKLAFMVANPPENLSDEAKSFAISWPVDLLLRAIENGTNVGGFIMPRASNSFSIVECYKSETRRDLFPAFTFRSMHKIARNLASAYKSLHSEEKCQVRVGYVKEAHLLVSPSMQISIVGTDCLQVRDMQANVMYKSMGNDLEFLAPELQGLSFSQFEFEKEHDYFGLAVLIFKLLMGGMHPFAGKGKDQIDPHVVAKRILTGQSVFGVKPELADTTAYNALDPKLQELFRQCFVDGHKDPSARPDADTWEKALDEVAKTLTTCQTQRQHVYSQHLHSCLWCEMGKKDPESDPYPAREPEKRLELKEEGEDTQSAANVSVADNNPLIRGANGNRQGANVPVAKARTSAVRPATADKKKKSTKKQLEIETEEGLVLFGMHLNISRTKLYIGLAATVIIALGLYTQFGGSSEVRATDVADKSVSGVVDDRLASIDGRVVSMRFFESSDPEKHRIYQDRFPKKETRAISWELGLEYPGQPEGTSIFVEAVWHDPDGAVFNSQRQECPLSSSRSMSYYAFGYGRDSIGQWAVGKYKVEMMYQGTKIAERTFEVY